MIKDMLSTDTDYIDDLRVILPKLRNMLKKIQNTQTLNNSAINNYNTINDSSIRISDSLISKSSIETHLKKKKGKDKTIIAIIGALAGIATIRDDFCNTSSVRQTVNLKFITFQNNAVAIYAAAFSI